MKKTKICKCCGNWYTPEPDEFEDTRICNECFRDQEVSQNPYGDEFEQIGDADNGL